mgnify:CR=1 FL=1
MSPTTAGTKILLMGKPTDLHQGERRGLQLLGLSRGSNDYIVDW